MGTGFRQDIKISNHKSVKIEKIIPPKVRSRCWPQNAAGIRVHLGAKKTQLKRRKDGKHG